MTSFQDGKLYSVCWAYGSKRRIKDVRFISSRLSIVSWIVRSGHLSTIRMKLFFSCVAALAAIVPAGEAAQPFSTWMADTMIQRGLQRSNRGYTSAVNYRGLEYAYNHTGNVTYYNTIKTQIDGFVSADGVIGQSYSESRHSLDDIRIGNNILYLYLKTGDVKYKKAADSLRNQIRTSPRTKSGGFWHRKGAYPNQMWLDGIYMADVFYAQYTQLFEPTSTAAWDDIILQYDLIEKYTRNKTSGLLAHGYDESKVASWADPVTGAAPMVWDRAVGWYAMALVDTLDYFPKSHPGYARLLNYLRTLAVGLKKAQDPASGGWWLVMNEPYPSRKGNYIESSGTAMFTYSLLKAMRLGYLDRETYLPVAQKAYSLMTNKFAVPTGPNGTLNWEGTVEVGSLSSNGSYEVSCVVPAKLFACRPYWDLKDRR